jgi:O-succinylhomoserine sulfhydrylase
VPAPPPGQRYADLAIGGSDGPPHGAGQGAAFETLNRLRLIDISNNLGDAKSLVTHPATTTHMRIGAEERAKLGIADGTVRISVGLEDVEDIIADLVQALGG